MGWKLAVRLIMSLTVVGFLASVALAECPEDKQPVDITTPSGITKTLCIPAAAVQGIENAAENSGGTIVASSCPCFTAEDLETYDALGDFKCTTTGKYDADGTAIYENHFCTTIINYSKALVQAIYDVSTVNSCMFSFSGDKYTGLPPVKVNEVISDSEYDTCVDIIASVTSPTK